MDFNQFNFFVASEVSEVPFFIKNCPSPGNCHEQPDVPSPRTPFSAWSVAQLSKWFRYEMSLAEKARTAAQGSDRPILFIGDSITEAFVGTSYGSSCGRPKERCDGVSEAWRTSFKFVLSTAKLAATGMLALGISGDQTQHLL